MSERFIPKNEHILPNRDLAYHYTVAMHFGQQLELNLRAILYAADYHGWGNEIVLTAEQKQRLQKTEGFIDKATCGAIITALRNVGVITEKRFFIFFEKACSHRNKLAHSFLADQNFDEMSNESNLKLITRLQEMAVDLYKAMRFSRAFRSLVESEADKDHEKTKQALKDLLDPEWDNPNRKYGTRISKIKAK